MKTTQKNNLYLKNINALVIDGDGVLWSDKDPLPGLSEFFGFLEAQSLPYMLMTNNATKTNDQFVKKLAGFGVTIQPEAVLTSSIATAAYLKREYPPGTKVYVVGQEGLRVAMQQAGYILLEDSSEPADVVVAGADFTLTYDKLKHATFLIRRGARFIGTNGDLTFPTPEGLAPGAGSILALLEAATGVKPPTIGKPAPLMFDIALEKMGTTAAETAMIGDRLDTDILGAQQAGLKTIMVTTGVDNEETCREKNIWPDIIFSGIAELTQVWQTLG